MSELQDDPYTLFLGLEPGPRPPNYYDLLGLELFCSHHERINQAVRKQFRVIKRYHDHHDRDTREAIQDIMNAIATARVILTDPPRKESYDAAIAKKLGIDLDEHFSARFASPMPEFELIVIAGPSLIDYHVELTEGTPVTIGTDARCDIPLQEGRSALRHCVIEFDDGDWLIRPTAPANRVHANQTETDEFALAHGDIVDVGGYRLLFSRIDRWPEIRVARSAGPPPLSLILLKGPSIPLAVFNVLPPQRITIGQADSAHWQLPDATVSKLHCAVQSVGDRWEIEDLESTNGTLVNDTEIMRYVLHDRDRITLGAFEVLASLRF